MATIVQSGNEFRITSIQPPIIFEEVEHLDEHSRGGIGSTGRQ